MKTQATKAATPTDDVRATGEALSRPQAPGQSKPSIRLFFFTSLSVIACALALANVASAAAPAGQDQYLEQPPSGGGNGGNGGGNGVTPTGANGTLTEADVKKAAAKNKQKISDNPDDSEEGASGAVGGAGTTPTPPAAQSVVASAKIGPLDRRTALILGALVLLAGLGVVAFGGGTGALFGRDVASAANVAQSRVSVNNVNEG